MGYGYDQYGNITSLTYPDSMVVTYGYDVLNRLTSVTDPQNETATWTYDVSGTPAVFTHFNGIITTYTYDIANRLLGKGDIVSNYEFTLDENGNRINSIQSESLAATPPEAAIAYGYNTRGNRLLSAGALSYSYDNEGQLAGAGGTTYTFDYNHRLAGIGSSTSFSYDGRGNRLSATRTGVTTRYIYDPWGNLLAEADGSDNITRKYLYGNGLLEMATPSANYFYHFNGNGNTTALTDINRNVVNSYAYDPFGTVLNQQESVPQPFKFVGQYGVFAEPSGLYYMRARYYDPNVGRFISEDPIGFSRGDVNLYVYVDSVGKPLTRTSLSGYTDLVRVPTIGTNLYTYSGNNPISFVDPDGQWVQAAIAVGVVALLVWDYVIYPILSAEHLEEPYHLEPEPFEPWDPLKGESVPLRTCP